MNDAHGRPARPEVERHFRLAVRNDPAVRETAADIGKEHVLSAAVHAAAVLDDLSTAANALQALERGPLQREVRTLRDLCSVISARLMSAFVRLISEER